MTEFFSNTPTLDWIWPAILHSISEWVYFHSVWLSEQMISGSVQVAAGHWYPRPGSYVNVSRKSLICDLVNWGGCCLIQIWSEAQHPTDQMIVEGEQMMINCFTDQMILGGGRIGQNCLSVVTGKGALHGSTVICCFRDERCHPALIENSGSAPPDVRSTRLWTRSKPRWET